MARAANDRLLAEIEKLRVALARMDARLGALQTRMTLIEGRLGEADDRRAGGQVRDPAKRVH